jgi:hypothetical protein
MTAGPPFEGRYRVNPTSAMRRPRGGDERPSPSRAAPGLRPGALGPPARSSLTVVGSAGRVGVAARQADEANWRQDSERHARSQSRKRGPAPEGKTPRWSAERRPRFRQRKRGKTEDWCAARCSIPSDYPRDVKEGRRPPRRQGTGAMTHAFMGANRAGPRRLFDNRICKGRASCSPRGETPGEAQSRLARAARITSHDQIAFSAGGIHGLVPPSLPLRGLRRLLAG